MPEPQACNFIKKETLAQVFYCEFCENSKNNFFTEHIWAIASVNYQCWFKRCRSMLLQKMLVWQRKIRSTFHGNEALIKQQ